MRKKQAERAILPVSMFVAGRPCLVVGGGAIAARKVGHLLDAEAEVVVVAPEAGEDMAGLIGAGRVEHIQRAFEPGDVEGRYLVFAATNSEDVNQQVLACCRERGILCSAVDSSWPDGDFVMPAITRKAGLVVTVATGGKSCRRSRVVKERIAEMIETLGEDDSSDQ